MSSLGDWAVPPAVQPHAEDYDFDLEAALSSVVGIRTLIPSDAFTAETLGDERHGNGVLLAGGLVLTIGYLIVEAETIWLNFSDGSAVQGHTLGYDQQTGFALVQPLARMNLPHLEIGSSSDAKVDDRVVIGSPGGAERSVAGHIVARQGNVLSSYSLNQHQAPNEGAITVICEHGTARFELHRQHWRWMMGGDWQESPPVEMERDTLFERQAEAFLDAIDRKSEPLCSLEAGLQTLRVNQAALASVKEQQWKTITR